MVLQIIIAPKLDFLENKNFILNHFQNYLLKIIIKKKIIKQKSIILNFKYFFLIYVNNIKPQYKIIHLVIFVTSF